MRVRFGLPINRAHSITRSPISFVFLRDLCGKDFGFRFRAMSAMSAITAIPSPTPLFSTFVENKATYPIRPLGDPGVTQA